MIDDELDTADYKAVKEECEKKITQLEIRLFAASSPETNIETLLVKAIENLSRLEQLWEEATAERKRVIIGSIFPEKLTFDGNRFQTARLIYTLNEGLSENENGQKTDFSALSIPVTRIGQISNRIWEDLRLLKCI